MERTKNIIKEKTLEKTTLRDLVEPTLKAAHGNKNKIILMSH